MSASITVVSSSIGQTLLDAASEAREELTIVTPFVMRPAFDRVMDAIPGSVPVRTITRWNPDDVARGISDPSVLEYATVRPDFHVGLVANLHAKIYLVDWKTAFVGSANLTDAGMGFGGAHNAEAMIRLSPVPAMLLAFVTQLSRTAITATAEIRAQVEAEAMARRQALDPQVYATSQDGDAATNGKLSVWMPSFRFPDRLYQAYVSLQDLGRDAMRAAVQDLSWIACPDGLSEEEFLKTVRPWLLGQPIVEQLDNALDRPRRFGELADRLHDRYPADCPALSDAKRHLQTILRWLLFFAPDRYRLTQQHYTEVISRIA
jgi:hypothetical protein